METVLDAELGMCMKSTVLPMESEFNPCGSIWNIRSISSNLSNFLMRLYHPNGCDLDVFDSVIQDICETRPLVCRSVDVALSWRQTPFRLLFHPRSEAGSRISFLPRFAGGSSGALKISFCGSPVTIFGGLINVFSYDLGAYSYVDTVDHSELYRFPLKEGYIYCRCRVSLVGEYCNLRQLRDLSHCHGLKVSTRTRKADILALLEGHYCYKCEVHFVILKTRRPINDCLPTLGLGVCSPHRLLSQRGFLLVNCVKGDAREVEKMYPYNGGFLHCLCLNTPRELAAELSTESLKLLARIHLDDTLVDNPLEDIRHALGLHDCVASCIGYVVILKRADVIQKTSHRFHDLIRPTDVAKYPEPAGYAIVDADHLRLLPYLSAVSARLVADRHSLCLKSRAPKADVVDGLRKHRCRSGCPRYLAVFKPKDQPISEVPVIRFSPVDEEVSSIQNSSERAKFPPGPISDDLLVDIVRDFCTDLHPDNVEELGCAVCGRLTPVTKLKYFDPKNGLSQSAVEILSVPDIMRRERSDASFSVEYASGPVLDPDCGQCCVECFRSLGAGRLPKNALARGLWLGMVPKELMQLNFVEKLLVARVRHNYCVAKVSSGLRKLKCNVVCFDTPIQRVYSILPPPVKDIDEVLAIIYSGPNEPTERELARTPFLVRKQYVVRALRWLVLNSRVYSDVVVSIDNLDQYPENTPPVSVHYRPKATNKEPESTSVFDTELEDGVEGGPCPFVVHGLTGQTCTNLTDQEMKGVALQHWNSGGAALRVGHAEFPQRTFKNPDLYPEMFPWLFPYGVGGIGIPGISPARHKKNLLLYHDKRFQVDEMFPFVAFNHEQINIASRSSWLLVQKDSFPGMVDRLLSVDKTTMSDLADRMANGEHISASTVTTKAEKACFGIINDLDHLSGKIPGSLTSKKWLRSEIWSLIAFKGAPLWYITLNPADINHPLCIYYAAKSSKFEPTITSAKSDRLRLIAQNPVACARFFDFMIRNFLKNVLGSGMSRDGLFGRTSGY